MAIDLNKLQNKIDKALEEDFRDLTGVCSCWLKDNSSSAYCPACNKIKSESLKQ